MANIGIITDELDSINPSGIKVYTQELVSNLLKIDKKNNYILIKSKKETGPLYRNFIHLPKILSKMKLDIVHEPTHLGPFFYNEKYKKVITIHDLSPLILPETRPNSYFTWLRHKIGLPILLKKVDVVITVSENTKKGLIKWFGINEDKIKVIYEAADVRYRHISDVDIPDDIKLKGPFILNVGTLEPRKNVITLIKVFHLCKNKYGIKHKLVIISKKGWKYKDIFNIIKTLRLENDINILQDIEHEELVYYYNTASVFVYPSLYEGFGLPVLEAMQCGCPVITSNTSSLPEVVGDAGLLVDPYDINYLSENIAKVLNDKNLESSMRLKGFEQAKKFSWEKTTLETIKVYESLL